MTPGGVENSSNARSPVKADEALFGLVVVYLFFGWLINLDP